MKGFVKWWHGIKGYGYITVESETDEPDIDFFCHWSDIRTVRNDKRFLIPGETVEFSVGEFNGKEKAIRVQIV